MSPTPEPVTQDDALDQQERERLAEMLEGWAEARDEDARLSDPLSNLRDESIRIARDLRAAAALLRESQGRRIEGWVAPGLEERKGTPGVVRFYVEPGCLPSSRWTPAVLYVSAPEQPRKRRARVKREHPV